MFYIIRSVKTQHNAKKAAKMIYLEYVALYAKTKTAKT